MRIVTWSISFLLDVCVCVFIKLFIVAFNNVANCTGEFKFVFIFLLMVDPSVCFIVLFFHFHTSITASLNISMLPTILWSSRSSASLNGTGDFLKRDRSGSSPLTVCADYLFLFCVEMLSSHPWPAELESGTEIQCVCRGPLSRQHMKYSNILR